MFIIETHEESEDRETKYGTCRIWKGPGGNCEPGVAFYVEDRGFRLACKNVMAIAEFVKRGCQGQVLAPEDLSSGEKECRGILLEFGFKVIDSRVKNSDKIERVKTEFSSLLEAVNDWIGSE